MSEPYIDTDVIIRFLTGDDPTKQAAAAALLEHVERGELELSCPDTVIADAVYVLSSPRLYRLQRADVASLLLSIVRLPSMHVRNRRVMQRALSLYGSSSIDFGDAMIVAEMERAGSVVLYSYDAGFDRIPGIDRREP